MEELFDAEFAVMKCVQNNDFIEFYIEFRYLILMVN